MSDERVLVFINNEHRRLKARSQRKKNELVWTDLQQVDHRRQRRRGCRGRDPQYLTCRGRPVLTTPNILTFIAYCDV